LPIKKLNCNFWALFIWVFSSQLDHFMKPCLGYLQARHAKQIKLICITCFFRIAKLDCKVFTIHKLWRKLHCKTFPIRKQWRR
jgi:hypothetical protein